MKLSPYMNLDRIEFVVTYQCSGRCKHCSLGHDLNRADGPPHIDPVYAVRAIERLAELFPITSVMTFGGEPLLYADVVSAIHAAATRCGIGARQLITNGYFTKSDDRRLQVAADLQKAGVNNLLLSVDVFHQEAIAVAEVHAFARHLVEAGLPDVSLQPAWVVNRGHDNPYNAKTEELLALFGDLSIPVSGGNDIFMAGNAAENLADYYDKPCLNMADTCGSMPYTEPLDDITSLSLVPNGDVMICGFAIGNIYNEDIGDIVARYNPHENPWMAALLKGGVGDLVRLAQEKGVMVDTAGCYSVCGVCRQITQKIANH